MPEASNRDERPPPDWPVCSRHDDDGCIGIRIGTTAYCLAHLEHEDPEEFKAFLANLGPGASLDLRGTQLSSELLKRALAPLRTDEEKRPIIGQARLDQAQFSGPAWFVEAQFSGHAGFEEAQFSGPAGFAGAQFSGHAGFEGAQFSGPAWFGGAQFSEEAGFAGAQFSGPAGFEGAQFSEEAVFRGAQFSGPAWFRTAQFSQDAGFEGAQFSGPAWFERAQFTVTTALGPLRADLLVLDR
jgi:uncharacterized protein YjbI with pentapeptide repeats